jgi:hypothetical protein
MPVRVYHHVLSQFYGDYPNDTPTPRKQTMPVAPAPLAGSKALDLVESFLFVEPAIHRFGGRGIHLVAPAFLIEQTALLGVQSC